MSVRIGRTLSPAVAFTGFKNIGSGILAMFQGDRAAKVFAAQLKEYFDVRHCFLFSSGKASLTLILQALKMLYPERDEVLIPAFTCYSVPAAIVRAGLKVRVCDVKPETLDFDYLELAEQLTCPRVLCVIPTHFFGVTADIPRVYEIIGNRNITVVEDAAQAMGAEFKGRKVGTLGDVGFFSLGRGKAFSTVSGGIILTNSAEIADALNKQSEPIPAYSVLEQLKMAMYAAAIVIFSRPGLFWIPMSLPFLGLGKTHFDPDFSIKSMSAFQAGLSTGWQERLVYLRKIRKGNADYLIKSGVKVATGLDLLSSGLIRFPVMLSSGAEKMAVLDESSRSGLGVADVYPGTVDGIAGLQGYMVGGTSVKAGSVVAKIVTVPVHPYVTEGDLKKIAVLLREPKSNQVDC